MAISCQRLQKDYRETRQPPRESLQNYCFVQNYCVLGSTICEIFTVISLQEGVGWEMFTVIWGNLPGSNILGRPVCRTKLPRKVLNFKTKNGPKNDPKLPRKNLSLVLLCRNSHRHYSKIFHREFPHKIKYFFTTRICRHGHANNIDSQDQQTHSELQDWLRLELFTIKNCRIS